MVEKEDLISAIICKEDDNILNVSKILRDTLSKHLLVVNKNNFPIGVISTIDINNRVIAKELTPKNVLAKDIMTQNIQTITVEDNYDEALTKILNLGTNSIPVLKDNNLVGLLPIENILKKNTQIEENESR